MTLTEYRQNTKLEEQRELAKMLQAWLARYTQDVYVYVMKQMESIINDTTSMTLIRELYEREEKERQDEISTIQFALGHEDNYNFLLHNHPITHSQSYRDILHDMWIVTMHDNN